ncbi:hypothetical protein NPJ88_000560 [Halomonas elongata]|uniref:hypothetical protein n=1 Tax=Halomonas elongata TaxID=2746 RepID=UPI00255B04D2|nr:hypothetical protein [Halomonas elongata]MDL4860815.1 hypothetical protein [Halomonas elongata]
MQAPFAFDSDGNLVISAKMVEALGLGKPRESKGLTRADPGEVIRAISGEIKQGDLHPSLSNAIDAITTEQQARADADSALASRASSLEARIDGTESALVTEQQARADVDSALAADLAALNSRLGSDSANWQSEIETLREEVQDEISRLDGRIEQIAGSKAQARGNEHSMLGEVVGELWLKLGETPPGQADD